MYTENTWWTEDGMNTDSHPDGFWISSHVAIAPALKNIQQKNVIFSQKKFFQIAKTLSASLEHSAMFNCFCCCFP